MKSFILSLALLLTFQLLSAQAPTSFRYQAVARDQSGQVITGPIDLRFTLMEDDAFGQTRYAETHHVITNAQGVFDLNIGDGAIINGDLTTVDWGHHTYWLQVEMKPDAAPSFVVMGTTPFLAVPYAMYAAKSGSTLEAGTGITIENDVIHNDGDLSDENELQTLSLNGTQLSISDGNAVTLPTGTTYAAGSGITINGNNISAQDASKTNELQSLSVNGTQLSISDGNTVTLPGNTYIAGSGITINGNTISAQDANNTNEIQALSINGQQLTLSNGGGTVQLPAGGSSSWNAAGNVIYSNPLNKNVSIGSAADGLAKLYVVGNGTQDAGLFTNVNGGTALSVNSQTTGTGISALSVGGRAGQFNSATGTAGYFSSGLGHALVTDAGNVGIGVLNPARKLHVVGPTLMTNPNGLVALEIGAGSVGIGITSPTHKFEVNGSSFLENNNGHALIVGNGKVGLGTSNPTSKLHVMGGSGIGLTVTSTGNDAFSAISNSTYPAGRFNATEGIAGFFTSVDNYCIYMHQGTYGTPANNQGMMLKIADNNWHLYVDSSKDYNFSYNGALKAYILDTDGSFHNTSDRSLKRDIREIHHVLPSLTKLQAYTYHMKDAAENSPISVGFMAQEVEAQFPELVIEKDGIKTLCYDHFAVLSVEAIKEQQIQIEDLKKEVAELKALLLESIKK